MTEYDIKIEGYKAGLTKEAVESIFEDSYKDAENIEVSKQ